MLIILQHNTTFSLMYPIVESITGEALSHCVQSTVADIAENSEKKS